jgi:uncharacterized membrane protein AbrB (regulator of aidB expression)
MFSGIAFGMSDSDLHLPSAALLAGQALIGCMVASMLEPDLLNFFVNQWVVIILGVSATVISGGIVGL